MNRNGYVLGIDGGGTHLRISAIEAVGRKPLFSIDSNPLGYFSTSPDDAKSSIIAAVKPELDACSYGFDDCRYVVCGMSGIDSEADHTLLEDILKAIFPNAGIDCMNDGVLALKATTGGTGILLNSGTGSIAVGMNENGELTRVGGWPYTVYGDEGSGMWISLKVLRLIGMWFDGLLDAKSVLIESVVERLSIRSDADYMNLCLNYVPQDLSIIPPLVDHACSKGDALAMSIMQEAYLESFKLAKAIAKKMSYARYDRFKLGLWGSNILNSSFHIEGFSSLFLNEYPNCQICLPREDLITFATELAYMEASDRIYPDSKVGVV